MRMLTIWRSIVFVWVAALSTSPVSAADLVLLHTAGSHRAALTDTGEAFQRASGVAVQAKYGPSGLLKDEIAAGGKAEVFASANMAHPQALAAAIGADR